MPTFQPWLVSFYFSVSLRESDWERTGLSHTLRKCEALEVSAKGWRTSQKPVASSSCGCTGRPPASCAVCRDEIVKPCWRLGKPCSLLGLVEGPPTVTRSHWETRPLLTCLPPPSATPGPPWWRSSCWSCRGGDEEVAEWLGFFFFNIITLLLVIGNYDG